MMIDEMKGNQNYDGTVEDRGGKFLLIIDNKTCSKRHNFTN